MRYHEGSAPDTLGRFVDDPMLIATAVYCIVIGIGALIAGIRAKQRWIAFGRAILATVSGIFAGAAVPG